ncbi:MAG TPA: hypothetical protein DDZ64_08340, partial [Acidimicrobiaceae bacterium]|nr:hypothetical protein [Acidimicrobiaceae bacterium]
MGGGPGRAGHVPARDANRRAVPVAPVRQPPVVHRRGLVGPRCRRRGDPVRPRRPGRWVRGVHRGRPRVPRAQRVRVDGPDRRRSPGRRSGPHHAGRGSARQPGVERHARSRRPDGGRGARAATAHLHGALRGHRHRHRPQVTGVVGGLRAARAVPLHGDAALGDLHPGRTLTGRRCPLGRRAARLGHQVRIGATMAVMDHADIAILADPAHTALCVVECQNGVIGPESSVPALAEAAAGGLIPRVAALAAAARAAGVKVVHCVAM